MAKNPNGGIENRKYPRRDFSTQVGILIKGVYYTETSFELGERGMLFETNLALRSLEGMVISFVIPGGHIVITKAIVRYQIKKGLKARVGVQFTNITFDDRRKVRDFIAQRKENQSSREQAQRIKG